MKQLLLCLFRQGAGLLLLPAVAACTAQQPLSWEQVKARFEANNPQLKADALGVDEMRANELTAYLRPNPQFTVATDGTQIAPHKGVWQPLVGTDFVPTLSYLHERDHKRELRRDSAREGTQIAAAGHEDVQRSLEFTLRTAFVNTLQAKAVLDVAKSDLEYYDKIIEISRERLKAGDLAEIDFERMELLRAQYEVEIETAKVNLRTAKIQLEQLMNDRTPVEQFDVEGAFEFADVLKPLDEIRQTALDARPDLRAALESVQQAETNHKLAEANGATDPTFSGWYTYNSSNNNANGIQTLGASVSIPLRIFDRNQGEKQRTLIDIHRNQKASEAVRAQVLGDVDSAYAQVASSVALLRPYRDKYKDEATRVRDTVTYSYQHGGSSLMDFLNAQSDYRTVQLAYLQLIGSYMTAAAQLNLAVGREVLP
ncbi:MAG: TolC family protein [Terracidiphilus sp.]|nr:TolC family protein [Terracidiphilus sp.]